MQRIGSGIINIGATVYSNISESCNWAHLVVKNLKRDFAFIADGVTIGLTVKKYTKKKLDFLDLFSMLVKKHPEKIAYISADTGANLTFKESEQLCHQIACMFYKSGYRKGDVVALIMENRIEFLPICLGLAMIGVTISLINYNLRGECLKHCIDICSCKAIISSEEMIGSLDDIADDLGVEIFCYEKCSCTIKNVQYLETLLKSYQNLPPPDSERLSLSDPLFYIYTSGTTGMPKAAIFRSEKIIGGGTAMNVMVGIQPNDIAYNALPMYHGNALSLACNSFVNGSTIVIKKKFSASQYMKDCYDFKVTVINYIGETCRYLLAQPKCSFDETNQIRLAFGNGLKASIWKEFKERFHIDTIFECYVQTEGNANMFNTTGQVGAVGFTPMLFTKFDQKQLLKVDKDTGEVLRGENGLAIIAGVGEAGLLVGKIFKNAALFPFDGYIDRVATEKAIIHDVFSKGDAVYVTGDILVRDNEGYYYFHDRTGDTFRWKGENVSTNQVEGLISKVIQLQDVCVYGVEVPDMEGKAGMACISDPDNKLDLLKLKEALDQKLPAFARPVFLRIKTEIKLTSTFKFEKNTLKKEGFNPEYCSKEDKLYFFDKDIDEYMPIDGDIFGLIQTHHFRF